MTKLVGDWRSGHWGGDRRMHLFRIFIGETKKRPACGVTRALDRYSRPYNPTSDRACFDCLVEAAAGRA